jgi:hypothetical protein
MGCVMRETYNQFFELKILKFFDANPDSGSCQPWIMDPDGKNQIRDPRWKNRIPDSQH